MTRRHKNIFSDFFESEKTGGIILIICTFASLIFANVIFGASYHDIWHHKADLSFANVKLDLSIEHWINEVVLLSPVAHVECTSDDTTTDGYGQLPNKVYPVR